MPRLAQIGERLGAPGGLGEFRAAGAAENRAAMLDDAADVAGLQRIDPSAEQPGVAVAHAEHFPAFRKGPSRHRAHRGIHAGASPPLVRTAIFFIAGF